MKGQSDKQLVDEDARPAEPMGPRLVPFDLHRLIEKPMMTSAKRGESNRASNTKLVVALGNASYATADPEAES